MSITTPLQAADNGSTSRTVLNDNFTAVEVAIEEVINDGAPLATTSVAGRSRLSSAPVDADVPIAVGTNDTRMNVGAGMTADEKSALAGGGNFGTPSGSNKFLTEQFSVAPQVVTFTSSGTWTKDAGLKYVVVEVQAAGGGGCGGDNGDTPGIGNGGAGGGYGKKIILASALSATETVTIGAGGGGTSSNSSPTAGTSGGASSFGALVTTTGGAGGATDRSTFSAGGTASLGDVNISGSTGYVNTSAQITFGGDSFLGKGGLGRANNQIGAGGYGAGGAGGYEGDYNGGNGTAGIVIVTEYY